MFKYNNNSNINLIQTKLDNISIINNKYEDNKQHENVKFEKDYKKNNFILNEETTKILSNKDIDVDNNKTSNDNYNIENSISSEYEEDYIIRVESIKNYYYPINPNSINSHTFYYDIHRYLLSKKINKKNQFILQIKKNMIQKF